MESTSDFGMEFFITLITLIFGVLSLYLKSILDNQANKNSNKTRDNILNVSIRKMESTMSDFGEDIRDLKVDSKFKKTLRNAIRSTVVNIVDASGELLKPCYQVILTKWGDEIEDIAMRFYYAPCRNNPDELERYLKIDIETKKAIQGYFIDSMVKETKIYNGKEILFSALLVEALAYKRFTFLVMQLKAMQPKKNGLDKDQVIETFTNFVRKFFENFVTAVSLWQSITKDE